MDHDGNVGGDEFLATLIDWGQVGTRGHRGGGLWWGLGAWRGEGDMDTGGCCVHTEEGYVCLL